MAEKKYTEEQLEKAMNEEYDTGYYNGWAMAKESTIDILDRFKEQKDAWTWDEVFEAIAKRQIKEFSSMDDARG